MNLEDLNLANSNNAAMSLRILAEEVRTGRAQVMVIERKIDGSKVGVPQRFVMLKLEVTWPA